MDWMKWFPRHPFTFAFIMRITHEISAHVKKMKTWRLAPGQKEMKQSVKGIGGWLQAPTVLIHFIEVQKATFRGGTCASSSLCS